jgi:hypothetical protein
MELFLEALSQPLGDRSDAGLAAPPPASDGAASLVEDGITVAHAADVALFDPLAASDERSHAAYEAALRMRKELNASHVLRGIPDEPRKEHADPSL